ncbi:MAG: UDP-N-acetylmuramate dehydrogenase [Candidatus Calescibacterium sp.]|nr:UDP-N-acetylmuramate dehydrogenase [Candidatus Calescibacterium sp.]MCX7972373.1 UDP-N-acetylmuramate dehydrogenase [bacterium]MDW8195736.1 UDP-N-acetylmuramate dehydrogenase [Candidatus Calescibacterium sp.]
MKKITQSLLESNFIPINLRSDIPLSRLTTYGIGGKPLGVIFVDNHTQYIKTLYSLSNKVPYRILGRGSNILANDENLEFFIITAKYRLTKLFIVDDKIRVFITPFTDLQYFINFLINHGIGGYEDLAGIPATVGGAVFNNAGTKNTEISDFLKIVSFFDRKKRTIRSIVVDKTFFSYRNSLFKEETLNGNPIDLVSFVFEFPRENLQSSDLLRQRYLKAWKKRIETQPINQKSCGSVFKNLPSIPAWKVISDLGYRGFTIGGAKVSEKHSNFIINFNNAKFSDVFQIIQKIKKDSHKAGIRLEEEVEIWK